MDNIKAHNMEKQKLDSISRRQFIGSIMLVTTTSTLSGVLLSACNTFSKTSPWLIGCYTRAWGSRNYLIALDGMVEAGYKYVGLSTHDKGRVIDRDTAPDIAFQVGEEIKKRGLKLVALSGGTFDSNAPVSEGIEQLKRLIDNAERCGAPLIQLNDIANQALEPDFYKVISECCNYGLEKKVLITVKPHGSTGAECREHVDRINHKNFKLWYDPGNVAYYTEGKIDPVQDAEALDGVVVGMAVKDFKPPKNVNITPGTGIVNFEKLIARLKKGGFSKGPLIVEQLTPGELPFVNAEARKVREYLERITS
ncbi:MAG: sugar phosphate isomerase/epimerase [Bacteroidales bacterium]|nr:sugar phosphate isomerase/epimerase [Bacteroidales bacterium]